MDKTQEITEGARKLINTLAAPTGKTKADKANDYLKKRCLLANNIDYLSKSITTIKGRQGIDVPVVISLINTLAAHLNFLDVNHKYLIEEVAAELAFENRSSICHKNHTKVEFKVTYSYKRDYDHYAPNVGGNVGVNYYTLNVFLRIQNTDGDWYENDCLGTYAYYGDDPNDYANIKGDGIIGDVKTEEHIIDIAQCYYSSSFSFWTKAEIASMKAKWKEEKPEAQRRKWLPESHYEPPQTGGLQDGNIYGVPSGGVRMLGGKQHEATGTL